MMVKHAFYQQNNGHLSYSPPKYLTPIAKTCWRKVVPFLEATNRVQRIDSMLVEQYCVQYQEYRNAYDTLQKEEAQQKIYRSLQDVQTGKVIGKDFVGWKKNPAVGRLKDATQMLNTIGIQLGLSPKSRAELFKTVQSKKEEGSTVKSIQEFFVSNKKR